MVVDFDPIIFSIGPVAIRWYGAMYVVGFILAGQIGKYLTTIDFFKVSKEKVDSLVMHLIVGMFLGARTAYVTIYNWDSYKGEIYKIFYVWEGGLSFHGALVGMILAGWVFARKNNVSLAQVMDSVALGGTQGLFFGRMGNFINGELYGREASSDFFLGMIFKTDPLGKVRHPSQLYEGLMEGIILSLILWFLMKRVKRYGILSAVFIMGYGFFRYIVEFFRQPDAQLGYYFGGTTTMGQILCFIMILVGVGTIFVARKANLEIGPLGQRKISSEES